jgi:hypothetical protein
MTMGKDDPTATTLEDILDEYAAAGPSREQLEVWIRKFPHYERELADLTVQWLVLRHVTAAESTVDLSMLELRGASVLGQVLYELRSRHASSGAASALTPSSLQAMAPPQVQGKHPPELPTPSGTPASAGAPPFASLLAAAAARGYTTPDALAGALDMSVGLVMALHRRLIIATSVPAEAIAAIGNVLTATPHAVRSYLSLPPTLAAGSSYKADRPPSAQQADFFALLREDPELSPVQQERWLRLEHSSRQHPAE